jgi:SAM-dependent methyltransferase
MTAGVAAPSRSRLGSVLDDLLDYLGGEPSPALEVGPGPEGRMTPLLAQRGIRLTCLEPDERWAAALGARTRDHTSISVLNLRLEDWEPPAESAHRFGILYAGQSWHLVEPGVRLQRARQILRPGGVLAVSWKRVANTDDPLRQALVQEYRRHSLGRLAALTLDDPDRPGRDVAARTELRAAADFTDHTVLAHRTPVAVSKADYLARLDAIPAYRAVPTKPRASLAAGLSSVFDGFGSDLVLDFVEEFFLARHTGRPGGQ